MAAAVETGIDPLKVPPQAIILILINVMYVPARATQRPVKVAKQLAVVLHSLVAIRQVERDICWRPRHGNRSAIQGTRLPLKLVHPAIWQGHAPRDTQKFPHAPLATMAVAQGDGRHLREERVSFVDTCTQALRAESATRTKIVRGEGGGGSSRMLACFTCSAHLQRLLTNLPDNLLTRPPAHEPRQPRRPPPTLT